MLDRRSPRPRRDGIGAGRDRERHVKDAQAKGARVLVGGHQGHAGKGGYWYEPTVLVNVTNDMDCMREETFGPSLPIMKVADSEEAIRLANHSDYGLCASVFSRDIAHAEAIARRVQAGAVTINDALVSDAALELPMGGAKPGSGVGYRHGPGGIRKYCRQQSLLISRVHFSHDLHTHPYRASTTRLLARALKMFYGRSHRG